MNVPALDQSLGIEVYSTEFKGIGGKIKESSEKFKVEEIIDISALNTEYNEKYCYALYRLEKNNIDSMHAIMEIEKSTGIKLKILGIKDARANTLQFVSSKRKGRGKDVRTAHCDLKLLGYTDSPLTRGMLLANLFDITIDGEYNSEALDTLKACIDNNTIANFYGYQRFGSSRPITHLVGKAIVKREFDKAVDLLLSYTSKYEREDIREIRSLCRESLKDAFQRMSRGMDLERSIAREMLESKDPVRALRRIPINTRRLFVESYQSYIFNRTLSAAIKNGYRSDLYFVFNGYNASLAEYDSEKICIPAVPLVGYAFRNRGSFNEIVRMIMEEEGVNSKDFYIKEMQELSIEGGFRQFYMLCRQFSYTKPLKIRFVLQKGGYATILLRELMKPSDPILAGF